MRISKNIALMATSLFLLSGCGPFVRSYVTAFHILPPETALTKYAFLPLEGQEGSLEYSTYKELIKSELTKYHYQEVSLDDASVVVAFNYGISSGKEKAGSLPIFGQTGVSGSSSFGTIQSYGSSATYSGTTTYYPTYGITGFMPYSYTEYMRRLTLCIADKSSLTSEKLKVLYEAEVASPGRSAQLVAVMPAMVKALFKQFPGESGKPRRETIPAK